VVRVIRVRRGRRTILVLEAPRCTEADPTAKTTSIAILLDVDAEGAIAPGIGDIDALRAIVLAWRRSTIPPLTRLRFSRLSTGICLAIWAAGCSDESAPPRCSLSSSDQPRVIDLQGAGDITIALLSDGSAYCWGEDPGGSCGYRSATFFPWPVRNEAAECLLAVGAGDGSISAGIGAAGELLVWGQEPHGGAGAGDGPEPGPGLARSTRLAVAGVRIVRMTSEHGLAVTETGELYYWGSIVGGWHIDVPTLYAAPAPVVAADTERQAMCFVTEDGAVYCFGLNSSGQLGIAPSIASMKFEPTLVPLSAPARKVEVGDEFACAHLQNGEVWCWGRNAGNLFGQPFEDLPFSETPLRIDGLPEVRELFANASAPCVVDVSDQATCWGLAIPFESPVWPPRAWHPELRVERLALGDERICALLREGEIYCEGANAGLGVYGTMTTAGYVDIASAIADSKQR
jgi:alpha-tubulin suppressor-like RCC1 family protein